MADEVRFSRKGLVAGMRGVLALAAASFAFDVVFGVLARQTGLSLVESLLMSGLVFAGSAQLIALGLWAFPVPVLPIVLTTLVINLRYLLLGAALRPWFSRIDAKQAYGSVFFMADENWALTLREMERGGRDAAYLLGSGLVMMATWLSGTFIGHVAGGLVGDPAQWGLDFAATAVFVVLLVGMWKGKSDLLPWAVAAGVAVVSSWLLPGAWYILLGGLAGSLVGALRDGG